MSPTLPAVEVFPKRCKGTLACMRVCPTDAIRVRNGKVSIKDELCIDCGDCIVACPEGAIQACTDGWESIEKFRFKVAITSPTLFGQFPSTITPADIVDGLLAIGFDAVHDQSVESAIFNRAIRDYLKDYRGPYPLISSVCPVVVRMIQVSYPDMVGQVIPLQPPREISGREVKRIYSEKLGLKPEEIGAVYISPCPAKMASIRRPAEGSESHLDLAIGIREIYNPLLAAITKRKKASPARHEVLPESGMYTSVLLSLAITGGESHALHQDRAISVAQLPSIIQVIEDIEKGKIRNVEFLECRACTSGCIGGPLTVDNRFVARSKLLTLIDLIDKADRGIEELLEERYQQGSYYLEKPLEPRPIATNKGSIFEQIEQVKIKEDLMKLLPGIDCGLCGSPRCEVFAEDVAKGEVEASACVMLSAETCRKVHQLYRPKNLKIDKKEK